MQRKRTLSYGASVLTLLLAVGLAPSLWAQRGASTTQAPAFQVDPMWPKPLPDHWLLGSVTGIAVDARDHIWIVHRGIDSMTARTESSLGLTPPGAEECCPPAPPVLEFDAAGALVGRWGGPGTGYDWPVSPGGLAVDDKGNVWVTAAGPPETGAAGGAPRGGGGGAAGAGRGGGDAGAAAGGAAAAGAGRAGGGQAAAAGGAAGAGAAGAAQGGRGGGRAAGGGAPPRPDDAHVLKFSRTGQFLLQIGKPGQLGDKESATSLNRPVDVAVDSTANEVYVADGGTSQRVVVFDATTGAHKRHWGGHGIEFGRLSSIALSKDGMVYVGDRKTDRIQVFKKDGTFVKEGWVSKTTMGMGSVWDVAFSSDPQQRYLIVADGQDEKVFVVDRTTLETVSSFGDGGRWPGTFRAVGGVAMDSKGNIYTGEMYEGKRVQKFVKK